MRNMFLYFKSASAVLLCTATLMFSLLSCDKEEESTESQGGSSKIALLDGQIVFRSHQGATTKAAYSDMATRFVDGDEIGVYAVAREANRPGELLEKGNYADNVRYKYVAASDMFVPVNKSETIFNNPVGVLDFYVYYPYSSGMIDATALPHYVFSDQTTDRDFTKSDLMTAQSIGYKEGVVSLQFKKMMACLEVIVNKREENKVTGVTLKNRDNGGVASLTTGEVETIDNKRDIRMKLFEETPTEYRFRVHLPAQTVEENEFFAVVTLEGGKEKRYNNTSALTLEKGMLTRYDITLQSRIKVLAGKGGTVSVTAPDKEGNVYNDGTSVEAKAEALPGWVFKNWQEGGGSIGTDNPYTFLSETNRTITAIFERGFFLVGTDISYPNGQHPRLGGNGSSVTPGNSYVFETKVQLTASPGNGFRFDGWTDGNTSAQRWEPAGPTDKTYTAKFSRNSYRVSGYASPSSGGSVSGGGNVLFGNSASLTASAASGYHFTRWSNGSSSSTLNISEVNGDVSYTAYFEANPVTPPDPDPEPDPEPNPNPNPNPGGDTDPDDKPDVPDPPTPTYCIYCTITGQGTVSGTGCDKPNGTYTLTATPAAGWSSSWTTKQVTVNGDNVYTSVTFTKNEVEEYYISGTPYPSSTYGTVTGSGRFKKGYTTVLRAVANPGYHFVKWLQDGSTFSSRAVTAGSNDLHTVTAVFEKD